MTNKTPFYRHTSILLAIAFATGIGVGSLSDALKNGEGNTSVLRNSAFVQSIGGKRSSVDGLGRALAYDIADGDLIQDLAGDSEDLTAEDLKPATTEVSPVPKAETVKGKTSGGAVISCDYEKPEKVSYKATAMTASQAFAAQTGDLIRVSVVYKNDSNTPWFSTSSGCRGPIVELGTTRELDRESIFFASNEGSGWVGKNRVSMTTSRVDPGEEAIFNFDMQAPSEEDLYREYFSLLIPGTKWIEKSESYVDIEVGEPYDRTTLLQKMNYLNSSTGAKVIDLSAEKSVDIDLGEQRAKVMLGDYVIREFLVSSGARKTPTPVNTWRIGFKEQVRIGGASPFYIMPNFQGLVREGGSFVGYGFHALPSLGNAPLRNKIRKALSLGEVVPVEWFASDSLWTEALDHIGSPRSHGCVRFLPTDAQFVFDFTEVGTKVVTHP